MPRPHGENFAALVDNLAGMRAKRRQANARIILRRPKNPAKLQKALADAVTAYAGPRHKAKPTAETRQAAQAELRQKLDAFMDRLGEMIERGEITAAQASEAEIRLQAAFEQFRKDGRLQ